MTPRDLFRIGLVVGLLGCGVGGQQSTKESLSGKVRAVCTTGMVADLVSQVGGDDVEVVTLMGAGVDPHLYKASPGDLAKLNSAQIIFYSGLHLEGRMQDVFERMQARLPTVAVTASVPTDRLRAAGEELHDPHVWFDVALWSTGIDVVQASLVKLRPDLAQRIQERASRYRSELLELDRWCRESLEQIPATQRCLVTAHDAFAYFGAAYNIEVQPIQGVSTESEAGLRRINELVELLTSRKIKAVFVESSVSPRNIEALVEGCAARGHVVAVGGELYSDAMGDADTPEGTYPGMIRHNVNLIVAALR